MTRFPDDPIFRSPDLPITGSPDLEPGTWLRSVVSLRHLAYMDVKVLLRQQRGQLKRLEFVASHFSLTVEPGFAFNHFVPCLPVIHKSLRSFNAYFTMITTHGEGLRRVR